uniref:Tetratricopeptide repeat protein 17-like protein n=1 Tax=Heliconius erato TaxID=33431 RepID=L7X3T5_HELEA|nr:tetratricopeptide repeat protein 17-like protein [Heliconius erato]
MWESPYLTCLVLYIFSFQIIATNSRTSNIWKLDIEEGQIVDGNTLSQDDSDKTKITEEDAVFNIITSTVYYGNTWTKHGFDMFCTDCQMYEQQRANGDNGDESPSTEANGGEVDDEYLDCGKAVNFTYYDTLVGVARRHRHPNVPEPQVALIFSKKKSYKNSVTELDINALEKRLKKAKREKPKSVQLYNQIGNFWRIKGDTRLSIECFRRALAVSPYNAEVLLNLARVLFTLQYLDDAIYLTRRSLEVQPPDRSTWQQYFTLGEIFKAYGHYQEAAIHLKHALDLRPDFEPALIALKDIENIPEASVHVYTLLIIVCLVMGVLLVILSSVDNGGDADEHKTQRHFNRAMAMRSLRGVALGSRGRKKGGS